MIVTTKSNSVPASGARQDEVQAPAPPPTPAPGEIVGHCPLIQIRPSPFNVRKTFDETDIAELAASIRAIGLTERLLVRPRGADGTVPQYVKGQWHDLDHFELVDGERRYRALSLLNETHAVDRVPIVIRDMTDDQVRAVMLATREQSRDLAASELVAGYKDLAEGRTADEVAAMVGRSPGHVRSVLRLAKLPAWALAAVDAGTLPRATAELVARVPGEESRKRAAAHVLCGLPAPDARDVDDWVSDKTISGIRSPLSYRETKQLLQLHFTRELKGCPFDRKSLDLLPEAGSCDACPKRAGNDPEATEEGVRADTCLDPDCYREKVKAYKAAELARAAEKGIEDADLGVEGFGNPPRGWCDLNQPAWQTDLHDAFPVGAKQDPKREEKLGKLLGKACPQRYLAFGVGGKAVTLVKTTEARKALVEAGVLKKPEPRLKAPAPKPGNVAVGASKPVANPGPTRFAIENRTAIIAADRCRTMLLANAESLAEMGGGGGPDTDAVYQALSLTARVLVRDWIEYGDDRRDVVQRLIPTAATGNKDKDRASADKAIAGMTPAEIVGLILALAAEVAMTNVVHWGKTLAEELLTYADTTAADCEAAARLELAPPPEPDKPCQLPVTKPVGSFPIKDVPKMPAAAVAILAQAKVHTLADLEPHVNKQIAAKKDSPIFEALRALGLGGLPCLFEAGDALVDHLHPKAPEVPDTSRKDAADTRGAANGKAKKARAAAKGAR